MDTDTLFPETATAPNVTRQVLAHTPEMMTVRFRFGAKGAEGALHSHAHVQSTYVQSGRFRFFIGGETRVVGPGDAFVIPGGVTHGCICMEPGVMIDAFTPRRDDFL
ncbi:MAG: cupin domain-containing protein [Paracoccaceae bacterium]|nr:MAG: cupin domain-containing protein [Paracoccaceae bacterium]